MVSYFLQQNPFLTFIYLQCKVTELRWISKWEIWPPQFGFLNTDTICSAMQSVISYWLKLFFHYLLLLKRTFRWALSPFPCSFLFAFHLEWFFNTSAGKILKCSLYICKFVFHVVVQIKYFLQLGSISFRNSFLIPFYFICMRWLKLRIIFILVLFPF